MRGRTIVFDLDGTLVDTAPDLAATLNTVLAREGIAPIPYATVRPMIGGGARRMLERGLRERGSSTAKADLDRLFDEFIGHYAIHLADQSRPYPGLVDALDRLAAKGCRLAVCTNKLEWLSVRLLDTLGLAARFAAICGQDTFGVPKPDPQMLRLTIAKAGGGSDAAVMVGDSATDVDTARAAGIPVVAVDFGYSEIPIAQLKPDRIISHFDDLPEAVAVLLAKAG